MKVGYLVWNLNDAAVERRCRMLEIGGAEVRLAGFTRDDELRPFAAARDPLHLGRLKDSAMVERTVSALKQVAMPARLKEYFRSSDVIIARNLEQLAIARRIVGNRPLVYECLDIHRLLVEKSLAARAVQAVESSLLPRADMLLTSSPAFLRNHFDAKPVGGPCRIVENKLLIEPGMTVPKPSGCPPLPPAGPLTIGWFGALRCHRTFAVLAALAERSEGGIEVLICGRPSPVELPDFEARVAACPGVTFTGAYSYSDLPDLYGRCHFAWTIDWFEEGLNSKWLLPNRIYEALAHGVVPIALQDVEIGAWLARHDTGLLVESGEDATRKLLAMSGDEYREMHRRALSVDRADLIADEKDCRELVRQIAALG